MGTINLIGDLKSKANEYQSVKKNYYLDICESPCSRLMMFLSMLMMIVGVDATCERLLCYDSSRQQQPYITSKINWNAEKQNRCLAQYWDI